MSDRIDLTLYTDAVQKIKITQVHLGMEPALLVKADANDEGGVTVEITSSLLADSKDELVEFFETTLEILKDGEEVSNA